MALKIPGKKLNFNSQFLVSLVSKYYSYFILLFLFACIGFGLFMGYTVVFDTLIVEKSINPSDIKSKEEKIDITKYTQVSNLLDKKITHEAPEIGNDTF